MNNQLKEMVAEGYVIQEDLDKCETFQRTELLGLMYMGRPNERSIAIRLLFRREGLTNELTERVMEILMIEKSFHTRNEICEVLKNAKEEQVKIIVKYLGRGGQKEEKKEGNKKRLPSEPVAKIIAVIGNEAIMPLMEHIRSEDGKSVCLSIEIVSYWCANGLVKENDEVTDLLLGVLKKQKEKEELRYWIVKVMGYMQEEKVVQQLMEIRWDDKSSKVRTEASKALLAIYDRKMSREKEKEKNNQEKHLEKRK